MEQPAKDLERAGEDRASAAQALRVLYAPVRKRLDQVERTLHQQLRSGRRFVDRLAKHALAFHGKRLRPALVLLSGEASGTVKPEHQVLATSVELIHTATLIHDDVLDEATLRRHLDTVNARWDNEASVLLGDYLFTRAIRMASELDDPFACRAIGQAAQAMCEGELRQIEARGNFDLAEEDYLEIIADKTAALTACCCRLGSYYAAASAAVCRKLTHFGRHLGVAFQIADDLLDLLGDEREAGKSLGTDLVKQKPTLPLIRLLSQAGRKDRRRLIEVLSRCGNHHREALRPWLQRSDAVGYTREKALWYAARAGRQLEALPPTPARDVLNGLTEFIVTRRQ